MIQRDEVFRIKTIHKAGTLAAVLQRIADFGAQIGEIETIAVRYDGTVRDVTVLAPDDDAVEAIHVAIEQLDGVEVVSEHIDKVFKDHRGGKIEIRPTVDVRNLQDMRQVYTPGVARVSQAIQADPAISADYTWKGKTVAIRRSSTPSWSASTRSRSCSTSTIPTASSRPSATSPRASAASTSKTSRPPACTASKTSSIAGSICRSCTTTSTGRPWCCWPRSSPPLACWGGRWKT
jgi:hypothetical protein